MKTANKLTPRIARMRERYFNTAPELVVERDVLFTKAYRELPYDRPEIRRPKALKYVMENIPVSIQTDELIVGSPNPTLRASAAYPELGAEWQIRELDQFETREQDPMVVSDETKRVLREELFPYWSDKNQAVVCLNRIPELTRSLIEKGELYIYWYENTPGHIRPSWEWLLYKGIGGIRQDAIDKLATLSPAKYKDLHKIDFLKGIIIFCEGMIAYGKRYAEKARQLACKEKDAARKAELEQIAEICEQVPEKPARNFREVLQFVYFIQVLNYVEGKGFSCMPSRLDQYAYPFYKKDIAEGTLTKEGAQELLDCLWIKLTELTHFSATGSARYGPGYMSYQTMSIGGLDREGNDATNELSYMCLQATQDVRLTQPSLVATFTEQSTPEFYDAVMDTLAADAGGLPALTYAENGMKMLMSEGTSLEDAREAGAFGCVGYFRGGKGTEVEGGISNLAGDLERTLHNGVSPRAGEQVGPKTGDPRDFKTYEEFENAFKAQVGYMQDQLTIATTEIWRVHEEDFPDHLESVVMEGCVDKALRAKSPIGFGPKYPCKIVILPAGLPTVANSLAAIKKLVFEEKRVSMDELITALDANFEGYEDLRLMLENDVPKYGNDDDYVDSIASGLHYWLTDYTERYTTAEGHRCGISYNLINSHVPMGTIVGATPDGRKAGAPLGDNLSPVHGTEKSGATGVIKSVCKLNPNQQGETLLNMKFQPDVLKEENREKFVSLIKSYWALGGYHVQFNLVTPEKLRSAQETPQEYRDLMVRIAGFSAYFTVLAKETQEDIIDRATYSI